MTHLRRAFAQSIALLAIASTTVWAQDELRVEKPDGSRRHFTVAEFVAMSTDTVRVAMHHAPLATYSVISLRRVLAESGVPVDSLRGRQLALVVVGEARDGYRVAFSLGELAPAMGAREVLLAFRRDGVDLPAAEGPFRLIVQGEQRQSRAIRQLARLRIVDLADERVPAR